MLFPSKKQLNVAGAGVLLLLQFPGTLLLYTSALFMQGLKLVCDTYVVNPRVNVDIKLHFSRSDSVDFGANGRLG
jgi:hypothetical protein